MSDYYLTGEVEKCYGCKGRGYTESENHPSCPICSGAGYVKVDSSMTTSIFRESGWKAEVKIIQDNSNETEERYLLEVIKTIRPSPYFGSRPDGDVFEVFAVRSDRHYVDWTLHYVPINLPGEE